MLPKSRLKQIAQLGQKKFRDQTDSFLVEGVKSVTDFYLNGWENEGIYAVSPHEGLPVHLISESEMKRISQFKTASPTLGVFKKRVQSPVSTTTSAIVLDRISDPGNLGTIIRLASWFGVNQIVCSKDTVDCYNPKVVQASMGGLARVSCYYDDLVPFLSQTQATVYGAGLQGDSIYTATFESPMALVFGSESHGFSKEVAAAIQKWINIPPANTQAVESLNVATAAAIVLSHSVTG